MIQRVYEYIKENKMTKAGDRILVGVSGGADSTCLLCVLQELAPRLGISLEVLHVDHGIRGESASRDAAFVEELCRTWGLPCHLTEVDVPALAKEQHLSLEAAGRQARYEAFAAWKERLGASRIAVAHHKSDQAETVLMNLFRGSGLDGLSGIRPVRGDIIRPLLCVSRQEIEACLAARGVAYCTDETNADNDAIRNKLRNQVIPFLRDEVNTGVEENVLRAARSIAEAREYLLNQAKRAFDTCARVGTGEVRFDAGLAGREETIILTYMLRLAVEECKGDVRDLTERHIQALHSLFAKAEARQLDLPGTLWAYREGPSVVITAKPKSEQEDERGEIPLLSLKMRVFPYDSTEKIPENRYTKWFDYDKINSRVTIRHRQEGDYVSIAPAGTKTLRRYFIDNKVPKAERDTCTLVADGSHILWIVGHRISEAYKVTAETKTVLEVSVEENKANTKEKENERQD